MYLDFYNLKTEPFSLSPDPRFLFLTASHKEAMAHLKYGLIQHKGFVVILGEVGTGKTTLLNALLAKIPNEVIYAFISNPILSRQEFFRLLAHYYKLGPVTDKADFLIKFSSYLERAYYDNKSIVLIIDEAHCLSETILEEIRLLSNLETPNAKLINIILCGQLEFEPILRQEKFLPLRQRISLKYTLRPLTLSETESYIHLRLSKAGADDTRIFTSIAIRHIYNYTNGIPRLINMVCDHALLTGFVKDSSIIDDKIIRECVEELEGKKHLIKEGAALKEKEGNNIVKEFWDYLISSESKPAIVVSSVVIFFVLLFFLFVLI